MATRKIAPAKKVPRAPEKDEKKPVADIAGLNPRQRAFVVEYLKDKNATAAYMRAYGSTQQSADSAGPRLFGNVRVRTEIERLEAELLEKATQDAGLTMERLTREVARGAFYDVRKLLDGDGNPIPIHLLDDDTASAISGLEIETRQDKGGDGQLTVVRKYKLADRKGFVDMGLKVKGGYAKDNAQSGDAAARMLSGLVVRFVEPGKT